MALARRLAPLLRLNKKRLNMARTNLQLCFPQKNEQEIEQLLADNLQSTTMAIFETGIGFFWAKSRLRKLFSITGLEHIEQAKAEGQGALLLSLHFTTLDIGSAILMASALGFIGLGAQQPTAEWGAMVATGRNYILDNWWYSTFPGLAILITATGFNLLGDGVRDLLDPRQQGK